MRDDGALLGRGIGFPPRIGTDGRLSWSAGEDNVRDAIRVIVSTDRNERLRTPEFGAGLGRFLFEPNTVATRAQIAERIERALAAWEPRIAVDAVDVDEDPDDAEAAIATIRYRLVATQASERLALEVTVAG
jgi:phage baseplate assembly protein W